MSCVFAGTFDPITIGHEDVILRAKEQYGSVIVVLGLNKNKKPLFTEDERLKMLNATFCGVSGIKVVAYNDIQNFVNFLNENKVDVYVRGIRNGVDMNYEKEYETRNYKMYPLIKTVYYDAKESLNGVSATLVRKNLTEGIKYIPEKAKKVYEEIIKIK